MRLFQRNSLCFEVDSLRPCFSSVFAENPNNVDTDHFLSQRSPQQRVLCANIQHIFPKQIIDLKSQDHHDLTTVFVMNFFVSLYFFSFLKESRTFF